MPLHTIFDLVDAINMVRNILDYYFIFYVLDILIWPTTTKKGKAYVIATVNYHFLLQPLDQKSQTVEARYDFINIVLDGVEIYEFVLW